MPADFGGVFWLELIGGMLLAVHRALQRMALVRWLIFFFEVVKLNCPSLWQHISLVSGKKPS